MKKINVVPYIISIHPKEGGMTEVPFNVRESIITLLFMPSLKLNAVELLKQNDLAEKISKSEGEILLEEAEYDRVRNAVSSFEGFAKEHVEFVKRVLEAETVKVEEAKN